MSDSAAERKRIQRNTYMHSYYNRKMLLYEYLRKHSLMNTSGPFEVTFRAEYLNHYDGYHHEILKYLVTDPTIKNFKPESIKAKLLMKTDVTHLFTPTREFEPNSDPVRPYCEYHFAICHEAAEEN